MSLEVTLSKNSWHFRLQKLIWGRDRPHFYSLCPYFWFTVFTIIIGIPTRLAYEFFCLVLKGLCYIIVNPVEWIWCTLKSQVEYLLSERTLDWIKNNDIQSVLIQIGYYHKYGVKVRNTQPTFLSFYLDEDRVINLMRKVYGDKEMNHILYYGNGEDYTLRQRYYKELERKPLIDFDNQLWWRPMIKVTKYLVLGTGAFLLLSAGAGFLYMVVSLLGRLGETGWTYLYFTALAVPFGWGIGILFSEYLLVPTAKTAKKTYKGSSLFLNMLFSTFKKACPAINWEENK